MNSLTNDLQQPEQEGVEIPVFEVGSLPQVSSDKLFHFERWLASRPEWMGSEVLRFGVGKGFCLAEIQVGHAGETHELLVRNRQVSGVEMFIQVYPPVWEKGVGGVEGPTPGISREKLPVRFYPALFEVKSPGITSAKQRCDEKSISL